MRVESPPTSAEFARHVAGSVRDFSEADSGRMRGAVARAQSRLAPMRLAFPAHITLVKTTGREDIDEPYCRGAAIILPEKYFAGGTPELATVLLHELFHVFSTHHPELRARLYSLLGFQKCAELVLPGRENMRRFTNPDAMNPDYYTVLPHEGRDVAMMPVLLGKRAVFDPMAPGGVFAQIDLVLVEVVVSDRMTDPVLDSDGRVVIHVADSVPAYHARMARNTEYVLHPEEVLADNFVLGVLDTPGLASAELPARVIEIMKSAPAAR
jgi:hypothetical protein